MRKGNFKKMKNKKLIGVLEGLFVVVLGILIAVCGIDLTVNLYFGILAMISGVVLLGFSCFIAFNKKPLAFGLVALGGGLVSLAIGLFIGKVSLAALIPVLVFLLLGVGAGLMLYGIYSIVRVNTFYGVGQLVIGGAVVTLTICYFAVNGFATFFWIIVGILVAVYGAFLAIYTLVNKD